MMKLKALKTRLLGDSTGATLVEFGLVAPPFFLLLLGIMDLGYRGYVDTMSKSILHQVARGASTGEMTKAYIEKEIKNGLTPLGLKADQITVETKSYFDFTNIGKPEKLTTDKNSNGVVDPGDCYIDNNNNDVFDTDYGIEGTGGPDDIVSYEITIVRPRLFPLASMIGLENTMTITNSTAVRNQPYGDQVDLIETCISDLD
ncbi:TadE/TadG family type IV pilus assembly protein [Parasphingorhabdus halotolerans]|uniref:Pilus assembly protein n=1 Tax=Parasphingorhabdus halotolerans TaxID=2725558 RepID=A0A6H2DHP6_9SPHN|nr:TadE/TadG family type IV pilus assembly protein [Parasphingorhabdus halotolerans]QJB68192.1 pilus assembly protein [Parasphingorhabdus halotolerans]